MVRVRHVRAAASLPLCAPRGHLGNRRSVPVYLPQGPPPELLSPSSPALADAVRRCLEGGADREAKDKVGAGAEGCHKGSTAGRPGEHGGAVDLSDRRPCA